MHTSLQPKGGGIQKCRAFVLARTDVYTKPATPNKLSNMYIYSASRLRYFGVKCVIIGHCFRHTSADRDRKRLRITDHSLGSDASYKPGNRKLHRRLVMASRQSHSHSSQPASIWDTHSRTSLSCTRCTPSILNVPFQITDADVSRNSKQRMAFGLDAILCPLAPVSYYSLQSNLNTHYD